MRTVLVIEDDTLIRELMREHLEREGYAVCAVATVRVALDAAKWTQFGLVLLDFAAAGACPTPQLSALRALSVPVVMMRTAPAGTVIAAEGSIEQVVWSPFDLSTLTLAVRRFLPVPARQRASEPAPNTITRSGTFLATRPEQVAASHEPEADESLDEGAASNDGPGDGSRVSLEALGELVLEATGGRRR